jgi:hypothetical protein
LIAVAADHATVLLVADLLQPIHILAVERFLDGDMRHRRRRRRAMPMLQTRRKPDDVPWPDLLDGPALALNPPETGGGDQNLAERMAVPRGSGTRFEGNLARANARAGLGAWNSGSIRTVPVKYSA